MSTKMKGITDFLQKMQSEVTEIRKQQSMMKKFMIKYSSKVLDELEAEKNETPGPWRRTPAKKEANRKRRESVRQVSKGKRRVPAKGKARTLASPR